MCLWYSRNRHVYDVYRALLAKRLPHFNVPQLLLYNVVAMVAFANDNFALISILDRDSGLSSSDAIDVNTVLVHLRSCTAASWCHVQEQAQNPRLQ